MSDDITFCSNRNCNVVKGCDCNPKNIMHPDIPHSFADYEGTEYCPKHLNSMGVKTYRKKPVEIQAVQFNGENFNEVIKFINGKAYFRTSAHDTKGNDTNFIIDTLEGSHKVTIGDYIIKGVKGDFYPCKPDIFKMTYEEVN